MSIIIKGINKPKDCDHCQFCIEEDVMFETEYRCSITGIYMNEDHCFPDICPIVELPEHHGGLIDVDATCDDFDTVNPIYQILIDWAKRCLQAQQVLIEAE